MIKLVNEYARKNIFDKSIKRYKLFPCIRSYLTQTTTVFLKTLPLITKESLFLYIYSVLK